jgi:hypothetical protein
MSDTALTRTVSVAINDEIWQKLKKKKPWSKFIREAIVEKLERESE